MAPLFSLALLAFATHVLAAPILGANRVDNVDNFHDVVGCGGLFKKAVCCGESLKGVVQTGCVEPFPAPADHSAFLNACKEVSKTALCCDLNVVSLTIVTTNESSTYILPFCTICLRLLSSIHLIPQNTFPKKSRLTDKKIGWQHSLVSRPNCALEGRFAPGATERHWRHCRPQTSASHKPPRDHHRPRSSSGRSLNYARASDTFPLDS